MAETIKHIKLTRLAWDQLYYDDLSHIIANLVNSLFDKDRLHKDTIRILDVACGTGEVMKSLSSYGFNPIGIDIQFGCALRAKKFGRVVVADLLTLDSIFPKDHFDIVISSHVLEHLENPKIAVNAIKKIFSKWLIVVVPNLSRLANIAIRRPRYINREHFHGWDCHHLKTFLEVHCQLEIVRWVRDGIILTPLRKTLLFKSKLLYFLEYKLLPVLMPQATNSLIVLCRKLAV